ncbi:hypothetical protein BJY04DRAFT_222876 [Aspergillus karnatakaensis]|uniref:uncharacterized protein n=1 Tax=Aspergillus karnatakaensis TaxID=1810916 RepID=UPI003CCD6EA8
MKLSVIFPVAVFALSVVAIDMDIREEGQDWTPLVGLESGQCRTFDIDVVQVNLVPGSNDGKSFICRFYE